MVTSRLLTIFPHLLGSPSVAERALVSPGS